MRHNLIKHLSLVFSLLICCNEVISQEHYILRGVITDLDGNPVRAAVRHSGGMSVAPNGEFLVSLKDLPEIVRFTAEGYITVRRNIVTVDQYLEIKLTPTEFEIEEVQINTGYQRLKPNEINGSVVVLNEEQLQSRAGSNILERIVGNSTGVLRAIGKLESQTGITIRGLGTINGPVDPLIVLDGFIYEGDITNINPSDIESVTILKDAAASSIWGARAGNGVIVLTSKRGKLDHPLQISMQAKTLVSSAPDIFPLGNIGAQEYIGIEKMLFDVGYFDTRIRNTPYLPLTPAVEIFLAEREGRFDAEEVQRRLEVLASYDAKESILKELYTRPLTQRYAVSARGGGVKNTYLLSLAYDHSKGENYNVNKRLNGRLSHRFLLGDRLSLTTEAMFTQNNSQAGRGDYSQITFGDRYADYLALRDHDGNPLPFDMHYRKTYTDTLAGGQLLDWAKYHATDFEHVRNESRRQELYATINVSYKLVDFLDVTASYQHQIQRNDQVNVQGAESYDARHIVNNYSQMDPNTGLIIHDVVPLGGIQRSSFSSVNSHTFRFQSSLNKMMGSHVVNGVIGSEARETGKDSYINLPRYGYNEDPLYYTVIDVITRYPQIIQGNLVRIGGTASLNKTIHRFVSFYGNASYSYLGKYTVSGSFRKDGSNVFGARTNDKWKPLWSTGLGWRVSDESFYNWALFPTLRLTATYGYSGNVDMNRTGVPRITTSTDRETRFRYSRVAEINNPLLRWEQLGQFSARLDAGTLGERTRLSLSYFRKTGTDLYGIEPYDYTTWGRYSELNRNVADMKGEGVELEIHRRNLLSKKLQWDTDFYFNWNESTVTKYHASNTNTPYSKIVGGSGNQITPIEGMPLYVIAAYKWAGLDNEGNPQGYLEGNPSTNYSAIVAEGRIEGTNIDYFGSASPIYFGSVVNNVRWANFSLNFNIGYRLGYFSKKSTVNYSVVVNNGRVHKDYLSRWQEPGDEHLTDVPSFVYPVNNQRETFTNTSSSQVFRADNIRLEYINLQYHINTSQWRNPLRNLEIQVGVENVGILWRKNKLGIDPDYPTSISPYRMFNIGLSMTL